MRNLKRALSLAMASVMLLGMMVVGTSAASYTDVSSEQNLEAIEVLKTVGIMTGDEKGNFNPDKTVTRNEMAVVMANLMDYRVASYKGTSPFSDVPEWAEPYVAACYTNGIVAGTSATTYGGDETVTTAQAALMLMKALGYFQYASDFESDWQLATVKQGNKIDLFDDVESGVTEAMTRNDVAQLVLNTLESGMVEADNDVISVNAPGVSVEAGKVNYNYVTSGKAYARAINDLHPVASTSISTSGYIVELGEKLFDGDLKKYDDQTDSYGRPGTEWKYKLDSIGTFAETPIAVYTAKVSKGSLYSLVGKDRIDDVTAGDAAFYAYCGGSYVVNNDASVISNYFLRNSSDAMAKGGVNEAGKGVTTEVYLDEDTGKITIVSIPVYVMQATADYNESKGNLTVDVITGPANVTSLDDDDFDIADYKEDDYILYTVSNGTLTATAISNGDVEDIAPATVVTGEVTAYSIDKSVTLDGTKYDYALWAEGSKKENGTSSTSDSVATEYRVGDTASIVVDANGYALYVDDAAVSLGNYLYVAGAAQKSGLGDDYIAKVYFSDGTKKEVTLDDVYEWNATTEKHDKLTLSSKITAAITQHTIDGWYTYSVNSDGEYTLRESKTWTTTSGQLVDEKVTFVVGGTARGNENTTLIVDDTDDITVYTGIKNFPETKAGKTVTVAYMKEKDNASKTYASLAIILTDTVTLDSKSNDTLMFVLDEDSHYVDKEDNERINVMNVILNGEKTTVECKDGKLSTYTLYTKVKVDSDGYYEGSQVFTADTDEYEIPMTIGAGDKIAYSKGSLTIANKSYIVSDDTQITVVLRPTAADANDELKDYIMTDPDADYELFLNTTGKRVDSLLGDYKLTGTAYATADDDGSEILESLVIVINGAEK